MRVFHPVEDDGERRVVCADARGERVEQLVRREVSRRGDCGDHALVVRARGEPLQLGAGGAADGHARGARLLENLVQASLVRSLRDGHALDGALPRAQDFEDGLDAEDVRAVARARPLRRERP